MLAWETAGLPPMFPEMERIWVQGRGGDASLGKSEMIAGGQGQQERPFRPHSKVMRAQWMKEPGGQPRSWSSCKIISLKE